VTILVVDDEPNDVEAARSALEPAGFTVLSADSYEAALEVAAQNIHEIELAILDISLPGTNGVDLFQALLRKNAALKVLFVSGHVGAEIIRFYGLRATNRHFLKKPFKAEEFIGRVHEVIRMREQLRIDDFDGPSKSQVADGK
jgi:two-component system, cell cycle sensor histidine kinase and response regulator CckA